MSQGRCPHGVLSRPSKGALLKQLSGNKGSYGRGVFGTLPSVSLVAEEGVRD